MADTPTIIGAITAMHTAFDKNLDKVYTEIKGCNKRVTEIETALAIKKARCEEKKKEETKRENFWRPIVRGVTLAGTLALFAIAWGYTKALWEKVKDILDLV